MSTDGTGLRLVTDMAVALVVALVVLAVSHAYAVPLVGLHYDDGQYVVAAKALATGEGYRQLHVPGEPPETKFPVVFPGMLALLWSLWPMFPANVRVLSLACSTALAVAAMVACLAARRLLGLGVVAAATWSLAGFTLPALAGLCARVMSEAPFLVFLVLALAALARAENRDAAWWTAGLALGVCVLTRSIGVFVIVGAVARCAWSRRLRAGLLVPALGMALGWFAWSSHARVASTAAAAYGTSYGGWLRTVPLDAWPIIVRDNLLAVFVHTGHLVVQSAMPLVPPQTRPLAAVAVGLLVVSAVAVGARRAGGPWAWVLGAYTVGAIAWPWPPSRFIVVVLPVGFLLVAAAARGRGLTHALTAMAVVITAGNVAYAAGASQQAERAEGLVVAGAAPARWSDYEALFAWIRTATPSGAVIASVADPMVYLYTGRQGVLPYEQDTVAINYTEPPSIGSADDLDRLLARTGAAYLVRMPAPTWGHSEMLDEVIAGLRAARPARLRRAWVAEDDPRFEVFMVNREVAADHD